eukprot:4874024-Prymnesium_polylepis.1
MGVTLIGGIAPQGGAVAGHGDPHSSATHGALQLRTHDNRSAADGLLWGAAPCRWRFWGMAAGMRLVSCMRVDTRLWKGSRGLRHGVSAVRADPPRALFCAACERACGRSK